MAELPMIISVDDHIVEPATTWTDRIPSKYHDVCPRIIQAPMPDVTFVGGKLTIVEGGGTKPVDWWHYEDLKRPLLRVDSAVGVPRDQVTMTGVTYEDMRPGSYSQKERLEDMDVNHIEASLCFPTFPRFCGQTFTEAKDKELALLCVEAYNDYQVEEWCAGTGGRLIPLIIVPLWDAHMAAAEVRRNADRGVRAVGSSLTHINAELSMTDFLMSGLFERFANLKVAYSEGQIGWIPHLIHRMDVVWEENRGWGGVADKVPNPPSSYFKDHVYGCFFDDPNGLMLIDQIGEDNITYESDYPHSDSTWPLTREIAEKQMAGLTDEQRYKVVRGNAIRLFGLDFQ